jgi:NAD+ synthase (glutamine-hydrolysing)
MKDWGFVRVTAASHPVRVADPEANAEYAIECLLSHSDSRVVVFGELSLSGYTCADLFGQDSLLVACLVALRRVCEATRTTGQLVVLGVPLKVHNGLYNVAALIEGGQVLGFVPKQFLPNGQEFYEARWFVSADGGEPKWVDLSDMGRIPFGIDLLFSCDDLMVGIELCEDLWMPAPPSSFQAVAGANLILNLSASNELVGKADWRRTLVKSQSGRCLAAYAYASCGPSESTTDLVFGGHCMIAESGMILAESKRVGDTVGDAGDVSAKIERHFSATADIDIQRLSHDRRSTPSWQVAISRLRREYRVIETSSGGLISDGSLRPISGRPFVPDDPHTLHERCAEIFGIQCAGLAKRVDRLPEDAKLVIGVSGGLDSTLALLAAVNTCRQYQWPIKRIVGVTMPGFGTTDETRKVAETLIRELGIEACEIDIRQLCLDTFRAIQHDPFGICAAQVSLADFEVRLAKLRSDQMNDLVFENVQARVRTLLLMSQGFVLGTGDLSEQALGWSTYNGDHISMYNVNTSIPKTLVRFLIEYLAEHRFQSTIRDCLLKIANRPISPELLPTGTGGQILQKTEDSIGSYELHDFFLYHFVRFGASPGKILHLAKFANFQGEYTPVEIHRTLGIFLKRFFQNQFKRSCVPDGPKVGSVSLSPRGDWRMPSDAEVTAWLDDWEQSSANE